MEKAADEDSITTDGVAVTTIELEIIVPPQDRQRLMNAFFEGSRTPYYGLSAIPEGSNYLIKPFYIRMELQGYVRYAFISGSGNGTKPLLFVVEAGLLFVFSMMLGLLFYISKRIIQPFHEISDLPYELSKGHLPNGIKETKNRFFGKFIWGLDLLRESLEEHKNKELKMEKDKKLMILTISHDIKTPLSTIKLYSKALYDDLYDSEEKKHSTAKLIEEKADQIEHFVAEIIRTSTTELFEFEVVRGDFYLNQLVELLQRAYEEKLELLKIDFVVHPYMDKLLSGDLEKLIDVFDNLIQNAIKYGDGREISLSFDEEDNCQLIKVTNSGIPIPSTDFIHMFESFWRGSNAIEKQGNGLGLYICKQIMLKMEGEIFAEAREEGMCIVVVLKKS